MVDRRKLLRLRLLARLRGIEHRNCTLRAASALDNGRRHRALAERARTLAEGYAASGSAATGFALSLQLLAGMETGRLAGNTLSQAERAEELARATLLLEREARYRRDRVDDAVAIAGNAAVSAGPADFLGRTTQRRFNAKLGTMGR